MEKITHLPDISEADRIFIEESVPKWHGEVKLLLPNLEDDLVVIFDNRYLIPDNGTGGFASSKSSIKIAYDPNFKGDKARQLIDLRGSYYHEAYHTVQGFTGEDYPEDITAIDNAILEGAATRFESLRAGTNPGWGDYPDRETILAWTREVMKLGNSYDYNKWKFYDPETDNRWMMYRVGTFIIDVVLANNDGLTIEQLATTSPDKILKMSGIN